MARRYVQLRTRIHFVPTYMFACLVSHATFPPLPTFSTFHMFQRSTDWLQRVEAGYIDDLTRRFTQDTYCSRFLDIRTAMSTSTHARNEYLAVADSLCSFKPSRGPLAAFPTFDQSPRHFTDHGMDVEFNHDVPMRDGIQLRADVFRPTGSAPPKACR